MFAQITVEVFGCETGLLIMVGIVSNKAAAVSIATDPGALVAVARHANTEPYVAQHECLIVTIVRQLSRISFIVLCNHTGTYQFV